MKNFKRYLDKKSGKESYNISVTIVSPWDSTRTRLSFTLEIKSAFLSEIFEIKFYIYNRLVNGENDEEEFEYLFNRKAFQESFKEDTYDNFHIQIFGVSLEDFEVEFIYK